MIFIKKSGHSKYIIDYNNIYLTDLLAYITIHL